MSQAKLETDLIMSQLKLESSGINAAAASTGAESAKNQNLSNQQKKGAAKAGYN